MPPATEKPIAAKPAPTPVEEAAQAQAAQAAAAKAATLKRARLDDKCAGLARTVIAAREEARKLRARADSVETTAGNIEGSIITARDVGRHDLDRALAVLEAAETGSKTK